MDELYEEHLRDFLREHAIQGQHLSFAQSCHSVAQAAEAAQAPAEALVKNMCLIGPEGELIVAIVRGTDRVSTTRIGQLLGSAPPRLATPEEILERTGYPCGGTPSFGFQALFVIDSRIFEQEMVFTGGGSPSSLVKISPYELQRVNRGRVGRIRK